MNRIHYYGMGPMESYCDKHRASSHGVYSAEVEELHEDYVRPQENGSHYDCSYVIAESDDYKIIGLSEQEFSFNASRYEQEELTVKSHNYKLQLSDSVVLCIDYAQSGVGSNSCGSPLLEKYWLSPREFEFNTKLLIGKSNIKDDF